MAPENSQNSNIQLNSMEIDKLENAFKNPEFRQLLVEYSKEINDPENRRLYEEEFKQYESETSGVECTFLHPQPGYVIKSWGSVNNRNQEKVFINICSDENVAKPASQKAVSPSGGKKGVQWSIPYSLTKARKDMDKAGLSCMVYDVIFHPNALALAEKSLPMRGLLNDTALEAVEKCGDQVKLDRKKIRFPKLKFKGSFHPTVIRKNPDEQTKVVGDTKENNMSAPSVSAPPPCTETGLKEPKYTLKYRHTSDLQDAAVYQGGRQLVRDPTRPSEIVIEVLLPEMSSAKTVELDVEEKKMTLESTEPAEYRLVVNFAYPVDEEKGSAKFDRSTHMLLITLPVKVDTNSVINRLTSTDSGIDIEFEDDDKNKFDIVNEDTAYRTTSSSDSESVSDSVIEKKDFDCNVDKKRFDAQEALIFPTYTCNVYDELMVLKLDVKNVEEESLSKTKLESNEGSGFSLRFTTLGSGMVPMKYGFDMLFLFREEEPGLYSVDDLEVEIWDNNIIVQMALPMADCTSYKVGNSVTNMKEHSLPQLRAFKQKRKQLMRTMSAPEKYCSFSSQSEVALSQCDEVDSDKERHSSGDSQDSALSTSPPSNTDNKAKNGIDIYVDTMKNVTPKTTESLTSGSIVPTRGILKTSPNRGRCYSESNAEHLRLTSSPSLSSFISVDSSIPEENEDEDDCSFTMGNGSSGSKKCVRFSEVVHRQVFRTNSSILGRKLKNTKKAEQKKRRAVTRRVSEGDVENFSASSVDAIQKSGSWMNVGCSKASKDEEEDSHTDSGVASSMEETSHMQKQRVTIKNNKTGKGKVTSKPAMTSQTKKKLTSTSGQFLNQANSDLIFDLDF